MRLSPALARLLLTGLALIAAFNLVNRRPVEPPGRTQGSIGDTNLQLRTIERISRGEGYYAAVGDELRRNGYPTSPIINWRTPLHYSVIAALSVPIAGKLLFLLGIAVVVTGGLAYSTQSAVKACAAGLLLLGAMAPAMLVRPGAVGFPEHWAAMFIALSLNAYVARLWMTGAALGLTALFIRELSGPYALVCTLLAFRAGRRREWKLWVAGGFAYAVYYAIHAYAAVGAIQAGDLVRERSYFQTLGLPFIFMTLYTNGVMTLLPTYVTPVAAAFGMSALWADSAQDQLKASLLLYFILFCVAGQPFNFYWGYLTSPIWAHAFIHAPEGLGALVSASRGASRPSESASQSRQA